MESTEEFSLRVGETVTRLLPGLGSAGYQWFAECDSTGVVTVTLNYAESSAAESPSSGSRNTIATIIGTAPGTATIELAQRRAFETTALHRIEMRVNVD